MVSSINWWILGPVIGFELGCAAFLLRGFWAFRHDEYQAEIKRRRAELRMTKKSGKSSHYVG